MAMMRYFKIKSKTTHMKSVLQLYILHQNKLAKIIRVVVVVMMMIMINIFTGTKN